MAFGPLTKTPHDVYSPVDGSGQPRKIVEQDAEILAAETLARIDELDQKVSEIETTADSVTKATWAELAAVEGTRDGQRGLVPNSDTGAHTDPVVGGTVPNGGTYAWSVGEGWQRVDDYQDVAALTAEVEAAAQDQPTLTDNLTAMKAATAVVQGQSDALQRSRDINRAATFADDDAPLVTMLATYATEDADQPLRGLGYLDDEGRFVAAGVNVETDFHPIDDATSVKYLPVQTFGPERRWHLAFNTETGFYEGPGLPAGLGPNLPPDGVGAYIADDGHLMLAREGFSPDIPIATEAEISATLSIVAQTATNIHALCDVGGVGRKRISVALDGTAATLAPGVSKLLVVIITAQSLGVGWNSIPAINTTPLNPGRALMLNGGVRFMGGAPNAPDNLNDLLDRQRAHSLVDLVEVTSGQAGQTIAATMCDVLLDALPSDTALVVLNSSIGGSTYAQRAKGTANYRNIMLAVERVATIARLHGLDCEVGYVCEPSGQLDTFLSESAATDVLQQEQADYDADCKAVTGQDRDVVLVTEQVANGLPESGMRAAQLQVAIDDPDKFISVGPSYHLVAADVIHWTAASEAIRGAEYGRAIALFEDATVPLPPYVSSAVRSGAVITCTISGHHDGGMVIDDSYVTDPGSYGVSFTQTGGNSVTIASVAMDAGHIVVTLSAVPTGTDQKLSFALIPAGGGSDVGPDTGMRSCFRDQSSDAYTVNGSPVVLHRWLSHRTVPVTV